MDDVSKSSVALPESGGPKARGFSSYVAWFFFLLAFYVLSIGPYARFCTNIPFGANAYHYLYYPLWPLSEVLPPFRQFLDWYQLEVWKANG